MTNRNSSELNLKDDEKKQERERRQISTAKHGKTCEICRQFYQWDRKFNKYKLFDHSMPIHGQ